MLLCEMSRPQLPKIALIKSDWKSSRQNYLLRVKFKFVVDSYFEQKLTKTVKKNFVLMKF